MYQMLVLLKAVHYVFYIIFSSTRIYKHPLLMCQLVFSNYIINDFQNTLKYFANEYFSRLKFHSLSLFNYYHFTFNLIKATKKIHVLYRLKYSSHFLFSFLFRSIFSFDHFVNLKSFNFSSS